MQPLKTIAAQLAIVLILTTQAYVSGQDLVGLMVGQSYFRGHQPVALNGPEAKSELESKVASEITRETIFSSTGTTFSSMFDFEQKFGPNTDAFSYEMGNQIERLQSRNLLEIFATLTNAFRLPPLFDSEHSDLLIARWDEDFLFTGLVIISPQPKTEINLEAFNFDHLELVWVANEFQLRLYQSIWPSRCFFGDLTARCIDTIPLRADISDLNLVLVPKATKGQFQFQLTISKAGKVCIGADPDVPMLLNQIWAAPDGLTPTKYDSINFLRRFIARSESVVEVKRAQYPHPEQARMANQTLKPVSTSDRIENSFVAKLESVD